MFTQFDKSLNNSKFNYVSFLLLQLAPLRHMWSNSRWHHFIITILSRSLPYPLHIKLHIQQPILNDFFILFLSLLFCEVIPSTRVFLTSEEAIKHYFIFFLLEFELGVFFSSAFEHTREELHWFGGGLANWGGNIVSVLLGGSAWSFYF